MIYLTRHTRTAQGTDICYGRSDVALASTWRGDIDDCLRCIGPVTRIFSSPSSRCRVLAEALAARDGAELSLDPRLLELDFGAWEGSRWDAVPRSGIDAWAADVIHYAPGNGESLSLLWSRVQEFRRQLGDPRCSVAVVSHHGPLRALAAQFAGESPALMFTRQWAWGCVKPIDLDPLPSGG